MFQSKKKMLAIMCLLVVSWFIVKPVVETAWSTWMGFVAMHTYDVRLRDSWENKSTDFLLGKLNHPSIAYSGAATSILRERNEPQKTDKLERVMKYSLFSRNKALALSVLFIWDEHKAINLSMQILNEGEKHPLFQSAINHLAHRKYEPAYPYVLKLAKSIDCYNNGSIAYLESYGKTESIPILEKMLEKPGISSLDRRIILEAIESIKNQNMVQMKSLQETSSAAT